MRYLISLEKQKAEVYETKKYGLVVVSPSQPGPSHILVNAPRGSVAESLRKQFAFEAYTDALKSGLIVVEYLGLGALPASSEPPHYTAVYSQHLSMQGSEKLKTKGPHGSPIYHYEHKDRTFLIAFLYRTVKLICGKSVSQKLITFHLIAPPDSIWDRNYINNPTQQTRGAEQDRLMEQAAEVVAEDYEDGGNLSGF